MARYTDDSRERVRDAIDFVAVVEAKTELRKTGAQRYSGRCPFHEERTPSFGIDPVEKLYHCFGCQAGGDVFKFVMETEGLSFAEALETLADRFNVPLERAEEKPGEAERRGKRDRLLALLERTAAFYVRMLWESPEAAGVRSYLQERGLEEPVLREFRVGYSPAGWDRLVQGSLKNGYTLDELFRSGLAQKGRSGTIDRFRGRLMFPLADPRGRVLGFGARTLNPDEPAKYLNSAEGDVFRKGFMLFGSHLARASAAKSGTVIVAEGYTDVIALHQAGMRNCVAIMGTALTEGQVKELARLASRAVLCLDADSAGQQAMAKSAAAIRAVEHEEKLRATPLELSVAPLPPGSDPADLVLAEGPEGMQRILDRAVPFVRFQVERALEQGDTGSASGRDKVLSEVAAIIRPLPAASVLREELVRIISGRLAQSEGVVAAALATAGQQAPAPAPGRGGPAGPDRSGPPRATNGTPSPGAARRALDHREDAEHAFLALCIAHPGPGAQRLGILDTDAMLTSALARRAAAHLKDHLANPSRGIPNEDEDLRTLIAELVIRARDAEETPPSELSRAGLHLELARLDRDISAARIDGDPLEGLARERQRVLGELRKFVS